MTVGGECQRRGPRAEFQHCLKFKLLDFTAQSRSLPDLDAAVGKLPGVDSVNVTFNSSKVKVNYDSASLSAEEIAKSISGLGYPVLSQKVS